MQISKNILPIPKDAYYSARYQYNSSIIISSISKYTSKSGVDKVLGITDFDLYVPPLNFVFGEAQYQGKVAIVSLHRLKPEFYGQPPDRKLFGDRAIKEAIHEIGHTLGLSHCQNPHCVMFFSLHIGMTDRKGKKFCEKCYRKVG